MSRRIPTGCVVSELDGALIALLADARRASEQHCAGLQARHNSGVPVSFAEHTAPDPGVALIVQACAIPARTAEGLRAKAEAARWWTLRGTMDLCSRFHVPQEWLAVSFADDLTGRTGA
ncbi:hypothetical protein [Roseomonas sp. WA12]